jgi:hypothetical protein
VKLFQKYVTPGLLVAIVALVVALTGSSIALPGKKSVDANDLKKSVVRTKALSNGAVTKRKLADDAVGAAELGTINTRSATIALPGPGTPYAETTANCQAGETVISGDASVDNQTVSEYVFVLESHKEGNGWHARAYTDLGGTPRTLTVNAYCLAP